MMNNEYIFCINPYEETVREIYKNNGFVTWDIPCAENKISENDIIYIYICKGENKINKSDLICFNECIVYKATVLEVLAYNAKSNKKLLKLHIRNIAPFAIEKLTRNEFSKVEKRFSKNKNGEVKRMMFQPSQRYPIDLSDRIDLKKHINKVLAETETISALPRTFEEKIICDFSSIKKLFSDVITDTDGNKARCNKLNGNIASNIISKYIQQVIDIHDLPYKVSEPNVYIRGCKTEWDALILKKDACNIMDCNLYNLQDVISVLEYKSSGIFYKVSNPEKASAPLKNFLDSYAYINSKTSNRITSGYITLYEYEPENGEHYFSETIAAFEKEKKTFEKTNKKSYNYETFCLINSSVHSLYHNKKSWTNFVLSLLPKD